MPLLPMNFMVFCDLEILSPVAMPEKTHFSILIKLQIQGECRKRGGGNKPKKV